MSLHRQFISEECFSFQLWDERLDQLDPVQLDVKFFFQVLTGTASSGIAPPSV